MFFLTSIKSFSQCISQLLKSPFRKTPYTFQMTFGILVLKISFEVGFPKVHNASQRQKKIQNLTTPFFLTSKTTHTRPQQVVGEKRHHLFEICIFFTS